MKQGSRHLALYLSAPHRCSYLPGQQSNTLFVDPDAAMDNASYGEMLRFGFRRSGTIVYSPHCEFCSRCISARLPVAEFSPNRSQRRVARANADVGLYQRSPAFVQEHFDLYQRYTQARHEDGDMAEASPEEYISFLTAPWCDTRFIELRLAQRLIGVAVTDVTTDALSAVYTFFDPALYRRSPGTLAILRQIELARALGLDYLYLGYWIRDSQKMAYKANFRPIELWQAGRWERLAPGEAPARILPDR